MNKDDKNPLLELNKHGNEIGKDPRSVDISELEQAGHTQKPLATVIRERCLDCCGFQQGEVRKCTAYKCPSWPYRMGVNPFTSAKLKAGKIEGEQE